MNSMTHPIRAIRAACILGLLFTAVAGAPASAQLDADPGLRAKLYGASVNSIFGGDFDSAAGFGLGLEYRASRRVGFELTALTSEIESQIDFDFFGLIQLGVESSLQVTPVLAQLDFHLTPDHWVDLHLGPVVGWMRYGDLETKVRAHVPGDDSVEVERVRTKDSFAWGAHVDMDVPLGQGGSFFTAGATYLNAAVKAAPGQGEPGEGDGSDTISDFNPLVLRVGFGYRF